MRLSVLLFLIGLLVVPVSQATAEWRILETPHFTILSSVSDRTTVQQARNFHFFREGILRIFPFLEQGDQRPLVIILVDQKRDLAGFLEDGENTEGFVGIHRRGFDYDLVINADFGGKEAGQRSAYGQYALRLLDQLGPMAPWVREGMVEIFETLDVGQKRILFGEIDDWLGRAYRTRNRKMDSERLLHLTRAEEMALDRNDRAKLNVSSTLIAHYFFQNTDEAKRERFLEYALRGKRFPQSEADLKERLGFTYGELDREIWRYSKESNYRVLRLDIDGLPEAPPFEVRDAHLAEANAILAQAKAHAGHLEDAEALIQAGLAADPDYAPLYDAQAFYLAQDDRKEEMLIAIERAVALGTFSSFSNIEWTWHLLDQALENDSISNGEMNRIARRLMQVITVDPEQPEPYEILCQIWSHRPADQAIPQSYLNVMLNGFNRYAYRDPNLAHCLTTMLIKRGETDIARQVVDLYFQIPRNREDPELITLATELLLDVVENPSEPTLEPEMANPAGESPPT